MKYPTKIDPVTADEIKYDRNCQRQLEGYEFALKQAWEEFRYGDLDDEINDAVADEAVDAASIACNIIDAIDRGEDSISAALEGVSLNVRDFRATITHIVEQRAQRLHEDGE